MIAEHRTIEFQTRGNDHIVDLTGEVQALVGESGVTTGQVALLAHGSTGSLTTLEFVGGQGGAQGIGQDSSVPPAVP